VGQAGGQTGAAQVVFLLRPVAHTLSLLSEAQSDTSYVRIAGGARTVLRLQGAVAKW
jgi:hypothetical protein